MKRNQNFILRELGGQYVLVPFGEKALTFDGIISLNETAKLFWDNLENDTDIDTLANLLVKKYNIDKDLAIQDTVKFIESLKEDGCIDE